MRKIVLSMQMTLDGFSTGPNDEMDYLPPFNDENMWKDLHEEMWRNLDAADTFILGRKTYQIWEKYWPAAATNPQSSESDKKFSKYADETQKNRDLKFLGQNRMEKYRTGSRQHR